MQPFEEQRFPQQAFSMMNSLVSLIGFRDKYTRSHSARVANYARAIATELGLTKKKQRQLSARSGVTSGLRCEEIALGSRIISVADSYDALTTDRPWRPALSQAAALAERTRCSGTQFDSEVVNALRLFVQRGNGIC